MPIMPAFVHVSVQNHACAYASAYDDVIVSMPVVVSVSRVMMRSAMKSV